MKRNREAGVALITAILVLMLMSALLVSFMALVTADQMSSGINRDQTQAYAAAHAGVEKLTADLGLLFDGNFSPTGAQVGALTTPDKLPVIEGMTFQGPNGTPGYQITFRDTVGANGVPPADGNPDVENPLGSQIEAGDYEGLVGLITPYDIDVTARTQGQAEVRMRRTLQTIAIPVFQFGIFSENNQSFFAGPNFAFGGRVHTNQHLFLAQDENQTLTLQDKVTAVGEIIRTHLSNGMGGTHPGVVRMAKAPGCPSIPGGNPPAAPPAQCFNLTVGSQINNLGSGNNEPAWTNVSVGTSGNWIRNGRTGATKLELPIVSDGATPYDLIRRAPVGEVPNSAIGRQRFHNQATLRILISDRAQDFVGVPGVVTTAGQSPWRLVGAFAPANPGVNGNLPAGPHPFAQSLGLPSINDGFRTTAGTSSIDGYIVINRQDRAGNWTDVTRDILSLGFSGRRLSTDTAVAPAAAPWYNGNIDTPDFNNACPEPHPNAVIRVQRIRDIYQGNALTNNFAQGRNGCGSRTTAAVISPTLVATEYWPNVLYDPREGMLRDDENARPVAAAPLPPGVLLNQNRMFWGGVMHYVELDVNNLRRWLIGQIGSTATNVAACANGAGPATCPMDTTGFVLYFSDRRGNRDFGADNVMEIPTFDGTGVLYNNDGETGELGFEDNINTNATSAANNVLDHLFVDLEGNNRWSEDINQSGTLQTYGGLPRLVRTPGPVADPFNMMQAPANQTPAGAPLTGANLPNPAVYNLFTTPVDRNVARVNRAFFFRRALKLVNGGRGNLPANGTQGLTVASENPVYIQGNYNACTNVLPSWAANNLAPGCVAGGFDAVHVSAAVIADAVTLLSSAWNDIRSFRDPHDSGLPTANDMNSRQAVTTWYRLGIISGKGLSFPRAAVAPTARDNEDFGTDGGAHNFLRYIENWGGTTLNYRGSLISFYTARQAVGVYKCCNIVYSPPTRGYNFEDEFLNPNLLPPRTPMFRTLNTLTFRQILRPTQ